MRITIEIPDSLLEEAEKVAARDNVAISDLIEIGLRRILSEPQKTGKFRLRNASFKGQGLQPGVIEGTWERIFDLPSSETK